MFEKYQAIFIQATNGDFVISRASSVHNEYLVVSKVIQYISRTSAKEKNGTQLSFSKNQSTWIRSSACLRCASSIYRIIFASL